MEGDGRGARGRLGWNKGKIESERRVGGRGRERKRGKKMEDSVGMEDDGKERCEGEERGEKGKGKTGTGW